MHIHNIHVHMINVSELIIYKVYCVHKHLYVIIYFYYYFSINSEKIFA